MTWLLFLMAVAWIAAGSALVLYTERSRELLDTSLEGVRPAVLGIGIAIFGLLLMASSFSSGVVWFIFLLGVVIAALGAYLAIADEDSALRLIGSWRATSEVGLRLWGLILVITGVAILAWI